MINPPVFVSYYTEPYKFVAARLIRSLQKWNLEHDVVEAPTTGSWLENTRIKPLFIKKMMNKHMPRPVVWIDADAEVERTPELLFNMPEEVNLAAVRWDWPDRPIKEVLSSMIWFKNNVANRFFLDMWIEGIKANPESPDQPIFERTIETLHSRGGRFMALPVEYSFIFDFHRQFFPNAVPCIVQYQHSRTQPK